MYIKDTYITIWKKGKNEKTGKRWVTFSESKKNDKGEYETIYQGIANVTKKEVWEAISEAENKKGSSFGKACFFVTTNTREKDGARFENWYLTDFARYEKKAPAEDEADEW